MDKIKKSFIVIMVLALLIGYVPVNIKAESNMQNYFNIGDIKDKKNENLSGKDKLKMELLNESIDESKISISVMNLTDIEKYFSIKDNQILISESFMANNQLNDTDKSLVLNAVLEANNELENNNLKVNEDYQIVNKNDNNNYLKKGGNINKTLKYWWGNRIYRNKQKTAGTILKYRTMMNKVGFVQSLLQALSYFGSIPGRITVGLINSLGKYFANDFINNLEKNNKGKYGTKLDLPKWFAGYGIYKQTAKTK